VGTVLQGLAHFGEAEGLKPLPAPALVG
jgi:hypothetical protein